MMLHINRDTNLRIIVQKVQSLRLGQWTTPMTCFNFIKKLELSAVLVVIPPHTHTNTHFILVNFLTGQCIKCTHDIEDKGLDRGQCIKCTLDIEDKGLDMEQSIKCTLDIEDKGLDRGQCIKCTLDIEDRLRYGTVYKVYT